VKGWEESLLRAQITLDEWLKVQANWMYLEPVFSSEDIQAQMPEEGRLFKKVDASWNSIMGELGSQMNAVETASKPGLYEKFLDLTVLMDKIIKGLNEYLEKKRLFFPRFFFLSNDEMLEILAETKDPNKVQPHLKKCFEGINSLQLDADLLIHGMASSEGERVMFSRPVDTVEARGCVEKWLLAVSKIYIF
jgi:dynein heavy chain